jgi:hypothetical protein
MFLCVVHGDRAGLQKLRRLCGFRLRGNNSPNRGKVGCKMLWRVRGVRHGGSNGLCRIPLRRSILHLTGAVQADGNILLNCQGDRWFELLHSKAGVRCQAGSIRHRRKLQVQMSICSIILQLLLRYSLIRHVSVVDIFVDVYYRTS